MAKLLLVLEEKKLSAWYMAKTGIRGLDFFANNHSAETILNEFMATEKAEGTVSFTVGTVDHGQISAHIYTATSDRFSPAATDLISKISATFCK